MAASCTGIYALEPRRKRYGSYDRRGVIPNPVSIAQRPAVVDARKRIGDWEPDTLVGKHHRGAIVSLTERKSRLALIARVPSKGASGVRQAILSLLAPLAERVHTLSDNGKEFALHEQSAEALEAEFYFAHPYASWERGLNKHTDGLIRRCFPKDRDLSTLSD